MESAEGFDHLGSNLINTWWHSKGELPPGQSRQYPTGPGDLPGSDATHLGHGFHKQDWREWTALGGDKDLCRSSDTGFAAGDPVDEEKGGTMGEVVAGVRVKQGRLR